jgi:hypothetical protein
LYVDNKSVMCGEKVFLRGLYEFVIREKQSPILLRFGSHPTDQLRAFKYFINHIYDTFNHLVTNYLDWWEQWSHGVISGRYRRKDWC